MELILNYWIEFLFTTITGLLLYMFKQYVGLKSGIKALLNNEIIRIYELYSELGYCPSYIKENVEEIYNSYHKLGGDGMITTMVNKLYEFPNSLSGGKKNG